MFFQKKEVKILSAHCFHYPNLTAMYIQVWSQLTFTWSKSTIETLEKRVKYVES